MGLHANELHANELHAKEERDNERIKKAPICTTCKEKTTFDKDCVDYICYQCGVHYDQSGNRMKFCVMCDWNKSNFDPADAGEQWAAEEGSWW